MFELMPLDVDCVSQQIYEKAERELGETYEKRTTCLTKLRKLLKKDSKLKPDTSDNFLLQFLRAKKFDTDRALDNIRKYYSHKRKYPEIYATYTPEQCRHIVEAEIMTFLPHRTSEGHPVWAVRMENWDPKYLTMLDIVRLGHLCMEQEHKNPVTQICGVVAILDAKNLSWHQILSVPLMYLKCFLEANQSCFPFRYQALHVINNTNVFGFLFSIIKPFLSSKIKDRFHFHGEDLASLHKSFPPESLPLEFGGSLESFSNNTFFKKLIDNNEEFLESMKFGYPDDS